MTIPENIEQLANDIRTKVYGREVREALASGIEAAGSIANDADVRSQETETKQTSLEKKYDEQIANMSLENPNVAEVVDARVSGYDGQSYTTIGKRFDSVDAQLAEKQTDLEQRGYNVRWNALEALNGDWTVAIQKAYDTCKNSNPRMKLIIPAGIYDVAGNLYFDSDVVIEGDYNSYSSKGTPNPSTRGLNGTVIRDTSTSNNEPLLKVGTPETFIQGFSMRNIYFHADNSERRALYLQNLGWSYRLDYIFVNGFKGGGITFDCTYDGTSIGVDVVNCGGKLSDGSIQYAVEFTNTLNDWDVANASHIFGLHIEFCRYSLKLDKSRHIRFIGCKIENIESLANTDYINPFILVTENAMEIAFDSSMFVMPAVKSYVQYVKDNFGEIISYNQVPYYIMTTKNTNSTDTTFNPYSQNVKFTGCEFTTSGRGSKVMKADSKVLIDGCFFNYIFGAFDSSLVLSDYSKLSDSHVIVYVDTSGYCVGIKLDNSDLNNVTIEMAVEPNAATLQNSYPVQLLGSSTVKQLRLKGNWSYNIRNNDGIMTKDIEKEKVRQIINDTLLSNLFGTINYSGFVFDLNKVKSDLISLNLTQSIVITDITQQYDGQEITIVNDSSNTVTIKKGTNIRLNQNAENIILNPGDFIIFKYIGYRWHEIQVFRNNI